MFTRLAVPVLALLAVPAAAHGQAAALPGDLGDVVVGSRSPVVYVPVTVSAGAPGVTFAATLPQPSGPDGAQFSAPAGTCTGAVASGATCFVGVRFAPTSAGLKTASLVLVSDTATTITTLALTGTGVAPPQGPAGPAGPAGPGGPGGAPGPAGPQGIPGRAIQATCTTKGKPPRTRCRIVILPDDVAATSIRVRLVRAGKTVARGSARREGTVRLKARRRVRPGRYTVAISFVADARRVSGRQVVRVR